MGEITPDMSLLRLLDQKIGDLQAAKVCITPEAEVFIDNRLEFAEELRNEYMEGLVNGDDEDSSET